MPTIEVSKKDLKSLIGKKLSDKQIEEDLLLAKGEIEAEEGDILKVEIADTNRPDLWSAEGIAREIKPKYKKQTLKAPNYEDSGIVVNVHKNLEGIRPMTVCAVARNVNFTEEALSQLIQLQEKVCETFGSARREAAIGVYDLHKITEPIEYKAFKPKKIKFIPLEFSKDMDLNQILRTHPKGQQYGHLLEDKDKYPIFIDSEGEVLSMPPVINSNHTGKVTKNTKDLFIECSGFSLKYLMPSLNVIVKALEDRGATIETVNVNYPHKKLVTPEMGLKNIKLEWRYVVKRTGIDLKKGEVKKLLKKAGYNIKKDKGKVFELEYSALRQDIMHPADVVEDVVIRYGYNNIEPENPELITDSKLLDINWLRKEVSNIVVGLGAQEILSYTLSNREILIKNMNLEDMKVIEIDNPVSSNWSIFRTWITPQLMEFFNKNTNQEYPQQIYEVGEVVLQDKKAETKSKNPVRIAWAKCDKEADFTEAKQAVDFLLENLGMKYEIKEAEHDSFIKGRVGRVYVNNKAVAYIGEIHPTVLENFGLDMPVCAFELNLTEILDEVK